MGGTDEDAVRFYFSFRSPYSWLALLRAEDVLRGLPVELRYFPVFPPPDFPNDPAAVPAKAEYIRKDVERIAGEWGISTRFPDNIDTAEWVRPHAAFVRAADDGRGVDFALAVFSARFQRGQDVGDDAVLTDCAREVGLAPAPVVAAAADEAYQTRVVEGMIQGISDGIFGVPYFVYRDEPFWGNDRLHWLVRTIRKAHDMPVVDLRGDRLQPLDR